MSFEKRKFAAWTGPQGTDLRLQLEQQWLVHLVELLLLLRCHLLEVLLQLSDQEPLLGRQAGVACLRCSLKDTHRKETQGRCKDTAAFNAQSLTRSQWHNCVPLPRNAHAPSKSIAALLIREFRMTSSCCP